MLIKLFDDLTRGITRELFILSATWGGKRVQSYEYFPNEESIWRKLSFICAIFCIFVGKISKSMKMKRVFLAILASASSIGATWAQRSNIQEIRATRYEVTSALDGASDKYRMMEALLAPYKVSVDSLVAPVLGQSKQAMRGSRPESLLGNWAADVLVEQSDFDGKGKADLGLANVGGLRNNMPAGIVRQGDIMLISPFQNMLCVVQLKGADLMELFRNIASVGGEAVSHEVKLVITKDGKLVSATVSGQPVDENKVYNVATLDYLAEGNDKMVALTHRVGIRQSQLFVRDVYMQSIRQHGVIDSKLEGRIVVKP